MLLHQIGKSHIETSLDQALFFHEQDLVGNLRRFPLIARLRLDELELSMTLADWQAFSYQTREAMVLNRFDTAADRAATREMIQSEAHRTLGRHLDSAPPQPMADIHDLTQVPASLVESLKRFDVDLTLRRWQALPVLARFGLAKLSREGHHNRRLGPLVDDLFFRDHPSGSNQA